MTQLFAALYLDEDVDTLVARLLRARLHDVITASEAGQLGRSDPEQLTYAVAHLRAIVTHNRRDFAPLALEYGTTGRHHYGIVLAVRRSPYELAQRLLNLLNSVTADEMENQVFYI
jgi:predicted nuclease of predicted toxin-antitoxin system